MNQLQQVFNYGERQVRTVIDEAGNPWFVAKDVSAVFGDTNYRRSIGRLDPDEKGVSPLNTPGGVQELTTVSEAGLYSLLFQMQPQKKAHMSDEQFTARVNALKSFKRWVTHEVLPAIRTTGKYEVVKSKETLTTTVEEYLELDEDERAVAYFTTRKHKRLLADKVAEDAPKVEAYYALMSAENAIAIGDAAKVLACPGVGPRNMFDFLREERFLIAPGRTPYQEHIDAGLFKVINTTYQRDGETLMSTKTVVTAKGIERIRQRMKERGLYEWKMTRKSA